MKTRNHPAGFPASSIGSFKMKNLKQKAKSHRSKLKSFKILVVAFIFLLFAFSLSYAASPPVRVKDIARVLEARENQLMGFGLVVGLKNTGDSSRTGFTQQAIANLLSKKGIIPQGIDYSSRNAAAVMVTATLPPFVKSGQKLDVTVSSMGDATSLQGGTLLTTPLQGADEATYAVAQGNLIIGIPDLVPNLPPVRRSRETAGRIPGGALVEKEVPVTFADTNELTIVLNDPDYTTASRLLAAVSKTGLTAFAQDAGTIKVSLAGGDVVGVMARIENLTLTPDTIAKVVVSEKTGTIVIGENVKLAPVAVAYGGINVRIGDVSLSTEGEEEQASSIRTRSTAKVTAQNRPLTTVARSPTLAVLVRALNALKASPSDLIAILQAMKKAGALQAELEVI